MKSCLRDVRQAHRWPKSSPAPSLHPEALQEIGLLLAFDASTVIDMQRPGSWPRCSWTTARWFLLSGNSTMNERSIFTRSIGRSRQHGERRIAGTKIVKADGNAHPAWWR